MKIQPVSSNINVQKSPKVETQKEKEKNIEKRTDTYTPSKEEKSVTYEKPAYKIDTETIERLKAESDKNYESLRQLIKQLLEKQGIKLEDAISGEATVTIDEETRLEAQAAISEGGPYSPESVSDRIVEFAMAISGGDKSKLSLLKEAIDEGFNEAAKVLGGTLPDISQETYDLVMEKLDAWGNEE